MKSRIFSMREIKTLSKGQLWIPVFLFVACIMAYPVYLLMNLGYFSEASQYLEVSYLYDNIWRSRLLRSGSMVAIIGAVLNGAGGFGYLYSARKVDLYHSLPVKRKVLFWQKAYGGIVGYMIPCVIAVFLAVLVGAAQGFFSLSFLRTAAITILLNLLIYLMMYFLTVLVIVLTGNYLMCVLCGLAVFIYGWLFRGMLQAYTFAFFDNVPYQRSYYMEPDQFPVSPIGLAWNLSEGYQNGSYGKWVLLTLLLIVAFVTASYFAYLKRPSESVGKSLVYPFTEPIIRILVMVPASLGIGYLFREAVVQGKTIWWICGLVIGAVLVHGMLGMLLKMAPGGFVSGRFTFLTGIFLTALLAVAFQKDLPGYGKWLPPREELTGISIEGMAQSLYTMPSIEKTSDGRYVQGSYDYLDIMKESVIEVTPEIYDVLKQVVRNQDKNQENAYNYMVGFQMKSGRTAYRGYDFTEEQTKRILTDCFGQKEVRERVTDFLEIENKYLENIYGGFCDGREYMLFQEDRKLQEELLEAVRQDYAEAEKADFMEIPCSILRIYYKDIPLAKTSNGYPTKGTSYRENYEGVLAIYPSFERTVAFLKQTGYPLTVEEMDLEQVTLHYTVSDENGSVRQDETEVITEPQKIEELKRCLISENMSFPGMYETMGEVYAMEIVPKNGREFSAGLLKEKAPEFVKERLVSLQTEETGEKQNGEEGPVG